MAEKQTRGYKAGKHRGESIIEDVNLMYQNRTAGEYYEGLFRILFSEAKKRGIDVSGLLQRLEEE